MRDLCFSRASRSVCRATDCVLFLCTRRSYVALSSISIVLKSKEINETPAPLLSAVCPCIRVTERVGQLVLGLAEGQSFPKTLSTLSQAGFSGERCALSAYDCVYSRRVPMLAAALCVDSTVLLGSESLKSKGGQGPRQRHVCFLSRLESSSSCWAVLPKSLTYTFPRRLRIRHRPRAPPCPTSA